MEPQKQRKPFFTSLAQEGNKCVVCKSTHVLISSGMFFYTGHWFFKSFRKTPIQDKFLNIAVNMLFFGLTLFHGNDLRQLYKEYKEPNESISNFGIRQIKIFLNRHNLL